MCPPCPLGAEVLLTLHVPIRIRERSEELKRERERECPPP
jgi:hypothetical protein